jgi:GMP synthase (glutamine-hydrolyzing), N-terminal domain or A subunit
LWPWERKVYQSFKKYFCSHTLYYFYTIDKYRSLMKVYVVDNGGQWTHREWRVLKYLGVDTKIVPNTTPFRDLENVDGLILSGGAPSVATDSNLMGNNGEYLDKANYPIMGICAGMQFFSEHFGGKLGPGTVPEFGKVELKVLSHDDLFKGLPSEFVVWASHNDEVKVAPEGFEVTATSTSCPVEGIRSLTRPIYGVQFHPEVENTENGPEIFRNFLDIVAGYEK